MNFVKPTVRLKLAQQPTKLAYGLYDAGGPDYWTATACLSTTEGQKSESTFYHMHKADALDKAYAYLTLCMKHNTLDYKQAQTLEQQEWLETIQGQEAIATEKRARKASLDYTYDRITREQYEAKLAAGFPEEPYVEVPAPGPKWSFWNWFK